MNIGPTQIVPVAAELQDPRSSPQRASTPNSGHSPKPQSSDTLNHSSPSSGANEVVKVHSDTSTGQSILIYEFVDSKTGSLVLQIPSEQMLGLVQEIRQRLQEMAASALGNAGKPEGVYGNQL